MLIGRSTGGNSRGRRAGEEPEREARRLLAVGIEAVQVPTDDAAAEVLVQEPVDRRVGRARDLLRNLVRDEWPAGAVGEHRGVQHDRPRWEVRERVEEIGPRQPDQVVDLGLARGRPELRFCLIDEPAGRSPSFPRRAARAGSRDAA